MRPEDTKLDYTLADRDLLTATKLASEETLKYIKSQNKKIDDLDGRVTKLELWRAGIVAVGTASTLILGYVIHLVK